MSDMILMDLNLIKLKINMIEVEQKNDQIKIDHQLIVTGMLLVELNKLKYNFKSRFFNSIR